MWSMIGVLKPRGQERLQWKKGILGQAVIRDFCLSCTVQTSCGAYWTPVQWVPRVNQLWCEAKVVAALRTHGAKPPFLIHPPGTMHHAGRWMHFISVVPLVVTVLKLHSLFWVLNTLQCYCTSCCPPGLTSVCVSGEKRPQCTAGHKPVVAESTKPRKFNLCASSTACLFSS
jgi:hypothetical protein